MRKTLAVACLAWALAGLTSLSPVFATDAPKITIEPRSVDLGAIALGATARASYRITNTGGETLAISSVDSRCGCIATLLSSAAIAPGADATLAATVDPLHMTNGGAKQIVIRSNDPTHPIVTLTLHAELAWPFSLSDRVVHFGDVSVSQEHTRGIELRSTGKDAPLIERAWTSSGFLEVLVQPQPDAERVRVETTLQSSAPQGGFEAELHLVTAGPAPLHVVVPVHGFVTGPVHVEPRSLGLGHLRPGQTSERSVTITAPGEKMFRVDGVRANSPYLTPTLTEEEPGIYRIAVGLSENAPPGVFEGALRVETSVPGAGTVTVPVSVVVR